MPTQEQISARETIIKAVTASINQQFRQITTNTNSTNTTNTNNQLLQAVAVTQQQQQQQQNQAFVNNVFSQMSYNDYKKQKIKSLENDIWHKVMNESTYSQENSKDEKHILTICEKKKIRF